MAGVVAARIAGYDREVLGQYVHDLAFTFIAPLGAQNYGGFALRHEGICSKVYGVKRAQKERTPIVDSIRSGGWGRQIRLSEGLRRIFAAVFVAWRWRNARLSWT